MYNFKKIILKILKDTIIFSLVTFLIIFLIGLLAKICEFLFAYLLTKFSMATVSIIFFIFFIFLLAVIKNISDISIEKKYKE